MPNTMKFTTWQDVMTYLIGNVITKDDGGIDWIAKRLNKARSTTYGYYEGRGEPSISEARTLHEDLVKEKDCHVVARFLQHEFNSKNGTSNGRVQDDFWAIHELSTDGARFFEQAKNGSPEAKQKYYDVIQQIKAEIKDLEAEGSQI